MIEGVAIVAGAQGLLGRHLAARLRRTPGVELVELGRATGDLRDGRSWADLPPADILFQLAARSFVPDSWQFPQAFVSDNLAITTHAADYCRRHNSKLVYVSSYLYGHPESLPIPETAPIRIVNPYALSKKMGEDIVSHFSAMFGFSAAIVRPFNIYGPGQDERFLIPTILRQAMESDVIRVMDLDPKRDYVFVDDVVDLLIAAAGSGGQFDIFNCGSGESHSVGELIAIVMALTGRELPVTSGNERRVAEVIDVRADIGRAHQLLGWSPRTSLRDGLAALVGGHSPAGRPSAAAA